MKLEFDDKILNSIKSITKKYEVYLVGGYLRNYFINNNISLDRDLATTNNPYDLASEISEFLDGVMIELDKKNEIYRVVLKDKKNYFDIAKIFNNDVVSDINRRDFTINSIFYDLNKNEIIDLNCGIDDIKNKIIKTFDFKNLIDDPLRFLRMYRFYSKLGFKIDKNLEIFSNENFNLINKVAPERINQEIMEIFSGEFLVQTLLKMYDNGVLELVFPFVKEIKKVPFNSHHHLDLIHHSIETVNQIRINKPLLKLAAFYHDIGKPKTWTIEPIGRHRFIGHDIVGEKLVFDELKKLKFSKKQINYISTLVKNHIYPSTLINAIDSKGTKNKPFARFVRKLGDLVPDLIELARADRLSARGIAVSEEMVKLNLEHLEELLKFYNESIKNKENFEQFLNGKEIMELLKIKPSKLIGEILEDIKILTLSKELNSKDEAIDYVLKKYKAN